MVVVWNNCEVQSVFSTPEPPSDGVLPNGYPETEIMQMCCWGTVLTMLGLFWRIFGDAEPIWYSLKSISPHLTGLRPRVLSEDEATLNMSPLLLI